MCTVRFPFKTVADANYPPTERPVVPLRFDHAPDTSTAWCLLDTGSVGNYADWELAEEEGIDLASAQRIPLSLSVGSKSASEACDWCVTCLVEDEHGRVIILPDTLVTFVRPWDHPGFRAVLGTLGMDCMLVTVSAGEQWVQLDELPAISSGQTDAELGLHK